MDKDINLPRSVFCVWPNPEWDYVYKHDIRGNEVYDESGKKIIIDKSPTIFNGMTPAEMCEKLCKMWAETKPGRTAACTYCVSADGLHHLHFLAECDRDDRFRYSAIQKLYNQKMHIEWTKGSKDQAEDYIRKQGAYAEKGEVVLAIYQKGEIKGAQGNRNDLVAIESLISAGKTPSEIMAESFSYRRYDKMIRDAYFYKRSTETPFLRDVSVEWHFGDTATGKTYEALKLVDELGEDRVYAISDYENGGLDHYCGQEYLFLDEFRGQWRYSQLLTALQGYKMEMHARNTNTLPLWKKVYITSPKTPDEVYEKMVLSSDSAVDSLDQLLRRITWLVYHWKDSEGYHSYRVPGYCFLSLCDVRSAFMSFKELNTQFNDDGTIVK